MNESASLDDSMVFAPPLSGTRYDYVIDWLHGYFKPRSYLELGLFLGNTFRLARCPSIGVDPQLRISPEALSGREASLLFEMTSDRFFDTYSPSALLGRPLDMAFLDGLHVFEALLRDFIHTEAHCHRNSIIVLHDCVPTTLGMARSTELPYRPEISREPGDWTGDVWKILPVLRKYRPDLRIHVLDAPPTGLVLVTNLSPASTLLSDRYHDIIDEFRAVDLAAIGVGPYVSSLGMISTENMAQLTFRAQHFTV